MAHFYGTVSGNGRSSATRCGTKSTGITATAETWTSVLRVDQYTKQDGKDYATFAIRDKNGNRVFHSLTFDADAVVKHADNARVRSALRNLSDAFDRLDRAAEAAKRSAR